MKKMFLLLMALPFVFCSCSSNGSSSFSINKSEVNLSATDTAILTASDDATWSSDNVFVASVDENGKVTANHVGEANISATAGSANAQCKVHVLPKYSTYEEPILNFTANMTTIKAKEKRTLSEESATSLTYKGENKAVYAVLYVFKDGQYTGVGVVVSLSYAEEATNFLCERYQPIGYKNDLYFFINNVGSKASVVVTEGVSTNGYILITYMPYTASSSARLSLMNKLDATTIARSRFN